ncbi:FadR/GntR family transcriptional regulator [Pseudonocardia sp. NPDC046786]|uniref:FadR/GntR family transcriptional regulator n=1 Tax=Pseudonocardia sp. NPDC046786 TaxID=3155471 RepID=UPI00340A4D62
MSSSAGTTTGRSRRPGPPKRDGRLAGVRRVSVVDELVEQMTRKIVTGVWPAGTMLPSLREFAADTGTSMLTVREAVRTLQARGWVETRQGVGTVVLEVEHDGRFVPWSLGASDVSEYVEMVEAREAIESAIVDLAAQRRTDAQLTRLDELLDAMFEAGTDIPRFLAADGEFHIVLAEAAHNRILLRNMLAIRSPMRRLMANRLEAEIADRGDLIRSHADHRDMVESVRGRDPRAGRAALGRMSERARLHLDALGPADDG